MTVAILVAVVFTAALLQALSGFGFALIVMPLVTLVVGLRTAAPLVALAGLTTYTINIVRFRRGIAWRELLPLVAASALGIPIGLWALANVDEGIVAPALGVMLVVYALYALLRPAGPLLRSRRWGLVAGFLAGCLGGAYNTPGPPVVVYGSLRQWPKDEFRAILQALFFINGVLIVASHAVARHLAADVWALYLYTVPALAAGLAVGALLDHQVDRSRFRTLVSVLILLTGLSLLAKR